MSGEARVGRHYAGGRGKAYYEYQRWLGELGARLDRWKFEPHIHSGDTVVDFGCGGGALLAVLPAARKIGIEVNEQAAADARLRGVEVVRATSDLNDQIADVVISNHALEHTLAPFDEVCALQRILKPGGRLILWLPLDDWRVQRSTVEDRDHHLYTWTPLLLRNLLVEASFEVHECRVVARAWPPRASLLVRLSPRAFDAAAFTWALLRRRRQLMAVARAPGRA
jgi:SAM-dependent methyltransferase